VIQDAVKLHNPDANTGKIANKVILDL